MPLKVALERAAANRASAAHPESPDYAIHPKIVRLKPRANNSAPSLETIFNGLNTCFLRIDSNNIIVAANPICLNWLQSASSEIIGRDFNCVFHGLETRITRGAVKPGTLENCLLQAVRRKSCRVDLHVHLDGLGAIIFFKDVTEQRRQARNASRASALMQASLNTLSAHVVVLDGTGAIVAANLAWQRFATSNKLTRTPIDCLPNYLALFDDISGQCPQARAIKDDLASVLSGHRQSMRQVYAWQEAEGVRWFELSASRLDRDRETHIVVINADVTTVKEAEHALGEAAETLLSLQEEERQRIAEELHDSTAQHLVAASLNLMGLRNKFDVRGEGLELLEKIESSLAEASKELRSFTYLLHPPFLEANGLEETVRHYVEGFSKRTGVKVRLRIGGEIDTLPAVLHRPLFRVIQEALANVYRHASASRVCIDMRCMLEHLHLVVQDNGRGMGGSKHSGQRQSKPSCLGVGIPGIRARLRQFGGRLVIKSGVRRGTVLHAIVPSIAKATRDSGGLRGTGNSFRAFGVSADVKKRALR
jgi:two-component system NarL family sensor kinase